MAKIYSKEEDEYLINNYQTISREELAKKIGVCRDSIKRRIKKLGLKLQYIKKNTTIINIHKDLYNYLIKKKNDFGFYTMDETVRKIIQEWRAFKKEKWIASKEEAERQRSL